MEIHLAIPYVPELDDTLLRDGSDRIEMLAPGKKVCVHPTIEQPNAEGDATDVITAYASFPSSVSNQVASGWLWDKLAAVRGVTVEIDHRSVTLESEEQLCKLFEEHVECTPSALGQASPPCEHCHRTDCSERRRP